jgi:hypothetical protein
MSAKAIEPKRKALRYAVGFLALLLILALLLARLSREAPPTGDLAVTFLGITNNPAPSFRPVRLAMVGGATGLCAIFRIANVTSNYFLEFEGAGVERLSPEKGVTNSFSPRYSGTLGSRWMPGYSCLYAFGWPSEVPTNESWRLVLTVQREPGGIRRHVNDYMQRDFFTLKPYAKHTIRSTEVDASVPFAALRCRRCSR